jgi:hypothetical protein
MGEERERERERWWPLPTFRRNKHFCEDEVNFTISIVVGTMPFVVQLGELDYKINWR